MTTNQTIDGVPRAALEILLSGKGGLAQAAAARELRALLDAPACATPSGSACPGDGVGPCKKCPAAQPQGEPVAEVYRGPVSGISRIRWIDYKTAPVGTKLYAEQPAPDNALKAFAREMINAAFEGGSFDGGDIQDIAVKHGLLRIERREEECGEVCACRSEGDGFPAECYRKTELLLGEQPAPVVVVFPERSNERDHAGDFTYEEKAWNACLDEVKRLNK